MLEPMLAAGLYSLPQPVDVPTQNLLLETLFGDLGVGAHYSAKSPKMVIDELFKTDELRALLYRATVEWGIPNDTVGMGAGFLTFVMWTMANWKLALGGTHTLAKAMTQACYREGVDLIENTAVERVIVEDGRAVGVRRSRAGDIRAERCVASNADLRSTLLDMVGDEHLSPLWVKRAKAFRFGPSHVLGTPMFCLHRRRTSLPLGRARPRHRQDLLHGGRLRGAEDMARYIRDAYMGRLPEPGAGTG